MRYPMKRVQKKPVVQFFPSEQGITVRLWPETNPVDIFLTWKQALTVGVFSLGFAGWVKFLTGKI